MQSIEDKIIKRIRGGGRGSAFSPREFLDLGSRAAVDKAFSRLVKKGVLRRVDRGIYSYPEVSPLIGELSPRPEVVAKVVARRGSQRLLPSGAYAANLLGLTDQVPAKIEYLTDGPSSRTQIKNLPVILKQTTPRNLAVADRVTGVVMQALRFLRQSQVDEAVVETLRERLSSEDKQQLLRDISRVPAWMGKVFREIAKGEE